MPKCPKSKTCPECGGQAYRWELRTRPQLWCCDSCRELFSASGRTPYETLREARKLIVQRWDQLSDDVWRLCRDMMSLREEFKDDPSWADAIFALDQEAWDVLTNSRPRLPGSPYARALDELAAQARNERRRVLLESVRAQIEAEKSKGKDGGA